MPQSPCWPRDTLQDYLNGSADDQRLEAIEMHLAECVSCEQTLLELERDPDTLVVAVRAQTQELSNGESQANSESGPAQSVISRAVDAVRHLGGPTSAPGGPLEKPGQIGVRQIGAYELLQTLGRGGMGLVMLARHSTLKKQVAIKILPSLIGDRPELVQRFQREIITAGQLNHPSIVHATDAGAEQGTHYLVMEYIDGLDLSRIARLGGPLSIADACEMMRQAALGLSYAHAQGVVHRDVKPSNLMLDTSGRVKILDFGLAQLNLWEEAAVDLTTVGQLMGTLDYMAPEQAERVGPVDYRADLYALGATLFRLLTGRAPLAASPNMTLLEKVRMLGSQSAPLVSTLRDDCPVALVQLIEQLLSRDPATRPASAAHVAEALQPFCIGHNLPALLTRCRERATAEPTVEETPAIRLYTSATPPAKPPRRAWLALAWLAPIAIFAGIVILLETQKGQLIIESDVAGVKVNLLQDGKVYQQLQVQTGAQSTRLFADKYAIEIDGASDGITIDQASVEIRRGSTVVARVKQAAKADRPELDLSGMYQRTGVGDIPSRLAVPSDTNQGIYSVPNVIVAPRPMAGEKPRSLTRTPNIKDLIVFRSKKLDQIPLGIALAFISYQSGLTIQLDYEYVKRNEVNLQQVVSMSIQEPTPVREVLNSLLGQCNLDYYMSGNTVCITSAQAVKTGIAPEKLMITARRSTAEPVLSNKVDASTDAKKDAAEPLYAGQTLSQWLDVLERDLDSKTRLSTLPAIERLSSSADSGTLERINRALVATIVNQVQNVGWTKFGPKLYPENNEGLNSVLDSLVAINSSDAAFELLKDGCLLKDGRVSSETIAVLTGLYKYKLTPQACDWLLTNGRLQDLEAPVAWAVFAFLENSLRYQDASFYQALPKIILDQPQLGVPALLLLEPALSILSRPEAAELEESVAQVALTAFLSDQSSPQMVAMSAHWLARTTSALEPHRQELVAKLHDRLKQLAADDDRLLAAVPIVETHLDNGMKVAAQPPMPPPRNQGGFREQATFNSLTSAFSLSTKDSSNERMGFAYTYSRSEMTSMLVLAVRLNAIKELDDALAQVAGRVFEKALPFVGGNRWGEMGNVEMTGWPFDEQQLRRLPKPFDQFSPDAWRAAKLASTLRGLPIVQMSLFNTKLQALMLGYDADLLIAENDKDGDKLLSKAEASNYHSWHADVDKDELITKEELIIFNLNKLRREYVRQRFGDLNFELDDRLKRANAVPAISEAQFAEIDADGNAELSLSELVNYGVQHPNAPSVARPTTSGPSTPTEDANRAWAERTISKYDRNKDDVLSEDEWQTMLIQPRPGTDGNADGKITVEELSVSRK